MLPPVGKGAIISVTFVVSPSVTYIANSSRTQRSSVPNFESRFPYRCDSNTNFKVKWSKVRVTRPVKADTHCAPYLPNVKAYELQTWYTSGGRRPTSAIDAISSKVKGQRSRSQGHVISLNRARQWPINRKPIVLVSQKLAEGYDMDMCYIVHQFQGQKRALVGL